MRTSASKNGISVHATAGTHSVLLGMDATPKAREGLLGFAFWREDETEDEAYWLHGPLTFRETDAQASSYSTAEAPVQRFHWADNSAKPDRTYTYRVVPMYGRPRRMRQGEAVELEVHTESETDGVHHVLFNRGASASQAFYRKFGSITADELRRDPEAQAWLSRGLVEGMLAFVAKAKDRSWAIHGSLYEFQYPPVLAALEAAAGRGAEVRLVVDYRGAGEANDAAIRKAGIKRLVIPRDAPGISISHNKFLVLSKRGKAVAVWTGSTNVTAGGLFGQSNVGHAVWSPEVAAAYLRYWKEISTNPPGARFRPWNDANSPLPGTSGTPAPVEPVFSPRASKRSPDALDYYQRLMDQAKHGVFLTAAFGVSDELTAIFLERKDYLRYVLMDNKGQTGNRANTVKIRANPFNLIALGDVMHAGELEGWHAEHVVGDLNQWVKYLHSKYMLIDPLSESPTVISGSANFSVASTVSNDENMLVIRGDTRVADIYLTEFMRLFTEFAFRNEIDQLTGFEYGPRGGRRTRRTQPLQLFLTPDDSWTRKHFERGSVWEKQRLYFSGKLRA